MEGPVGPERAENVTVAPDRSVGRVEKRSPMCGEPPDQKVGFGDA